MSNPNKPVTHSELNLMIGPLLDRQSEQLEVSKETNKSLQELALSIRDLASEKKHLEKEVETVKSDVSNIKRQFFSTWEWAQKLRDGMFRWIIPLICTGIFLSVATAMGYIKVSG